MSKQTAVEWLRDYILEHCNPSVCNIEWSDFKQAITQALAMEREQIEEAYSTGLRYGMAHYIVEVTDEEADPANYYQRTYGKEADNANG